MPRKPKKPSQPKPESASPDTRLTVAPPPERPWQLTSEEITIVKNSIAKGATDKELEYCLTVARRYKLDPFKQQIWFVQRWDKSADNGHGGQGANVWTPQVGINGLLFAASRDHYAEFGSVSLPDYGPMIEADYKVNGKPLKVPEWAKVAVFKKGVETPTVAIAYWEEYCPADMSKAPFWRKMPRRMIGKCATALAIKQAYPDLGGVYIPEECDRMNDDLTPGGRRIVEANPQNAPRQQAQAVLEAKLKGDIPLHGETEIVAPGGSQSPESGIPPATPPPPMGEVASARWQVTLDWTDEANPVVMGDAEALEVLKDPLNLTWGEDGFWHLAPRQAERLRVMAQEFPFQLKEVMPKPKQDPNPAPVKKPAPSKESGGAEPFTVTGTIQHISEKMTKGKGSRPPSPYLSVLLKTQKGDRWFSVWDRDLFEFLNKGKGKEGEFFATQSGEYWNIVGISRISSRHFQDGKIPVVDRSEDRNASLFGNS